MPPVPKKPKTLSASKLISRCDKVASLIVRERAGNKCEKCGRSKAQGYMVSHAHILRRGHKSVRWHPDNGFCLCVRCHFWMDNSTNRGDVDDWIREKIGKKYENLKLLSRKDDVWYTVDLRRKLDELKENLSQIAPWKL